MLGCSFGIVRCRKEAFVLGERMRERARACVCRCAEMRAAIWGR